MTWEAFEDAGIVPASLAGSRTGVFVGGFFMDMAGLEHDGHPAWPGVWQEAASFLREKIRAQK